MGSMRLAIKTNKLNQFSSTIDGCRSFKWTPILHELNIKNHVLIQQAVKALAKQAAAARAKAKKPQPKL